MTDVPPPVIRVVQAKPPADHVTFKSAFLTRLPTSNHFLFILLTFGVVLYILDMIRVNPKLLANASYMQLVTAIVAILAIIGNNLFAGTKSGSQVMTNQSDAIIKQAATTNPPPTVIAAWASGVAYTVGPPASVVTQAGKTYVCAISHTSADFATDLAAGKWTVSA